MDTQYDTQTWSPGKADFRESPPEYAQRSLLHGLVLAVRSGHAASDAGDDADGEDLDDEDGADMDEEDL